MDKHCHSVYTEGMTKERALTKLELVPAIVGGREGYIEARWRRSDGSSGKAVAYFRLRAAERWYIAQITVGTPTTELLRDVPLARIETAANADPEVRAWLEKSADPETVERARRAAGRRPRLKRPPGRRLDDAFYRRVAKAYRAAVAHGLPPVKTLAADSETPPGTVSRWIAEARKPSRGFLPPGEQGRVTTHVSIEPARETSAAQPLTASKRRRKE